MKRLIAYENNTVRMFGPGRGGLVFSDPVSGVTREHEAREIGYMVSPKGFTPTWRIQVKEEVHKARCRGEC